MYWIKTPRWIQWLFSDYQWRFPANNKTIYLTFDDGPCPQITSWVLQQLQQYNAFATFFCVGKNVEENPVLYKKILREGHAVGNHTQQHANGWRTPFSQYCQQVEQCRQWVDSPLFRPPYGKITPAQSAWLQKQGYKLILWDSLPGDFDTAISGEKCLQNAIKSISDGSIVALHDSAKAWERLHFVLPRLLAHFSSLGFSFKKITQV